MKRALLAVLALVLVLALAGWQWSRPKDDIALPGPDASPAQTVEAYVEALNARDFATANAILSDEHRQPWRRFSRSPRLEDLRIGDSIRQSAGPEDGESRADAYEEAVYVQVTYNLHGGDISMPDGPTDWSYVVARDNTDERWRIIDQGVG